MRVVLSQRVGLVPLTLRVRVRRECAAEDRLLRLTVSLNGFPIQTTERQLEGCDDPLTFDFLREIREPGVYLFVADLLPTGDHAEISAEFQ